MGTHSLFRQHTHLTHLYDSPCQRSSGKDTGASCLSHISHEKIIRAEADMTEYLVVHIQKDRHFGQTKCAGTYPYCMCLSEHSQQCWIPPCANCLTDQSEAPKSVLTSSPVSQHQTRHQAQTWKYP